VVERKNGGHTRRHFAVVQVPGVLDRVVIVSTHGEARVRFVLLEDIIARHLGELFGGLRVVSHTVFRVTRNTDLTIEEEDAEDLLERSRRAAAAAPQRPRPPGDLVGRRRDLRRDADGSARPRRARRVRVPGPVDVTALMALHRLDGFPAFKDDPLVPAWRLRSHRGATCST